MKNKRFYDYILNSNYLDNVCNYFIDGDNSNWDDWYDNASRQDLETLVDEWVSSLELNERNEINLNYIMWEVKECHL